MIFLAYNGTLWTYHYLYAIGVVYRKDHYFLYEYEVADFAIYRYATVFVDAYGSPENVSSEFVTRYIYVFYHSDVVVNGTL